jgi:transcription antitermination factor NusG
VLGQLNTLRIPVPSFDKETTAESELVELTEGLRVQVFQKPFYGMTGTISSVQGSSVYVNLSGANEPIQFSLPNILAVD